MEIVLGEPCVNVNGLEIAFFAATGSYNIRNIKIVSNIQYAIFTSTMISDVLVGEHVY